MSALVPGRRPRHMRRGGERGMHGPGIPVWLTALLALGVALACATLMSPWGRSLGTVPGEAPGSLSVEGQGLTEVGERTYRVDRAGASLVISFDEPVEARTVTLDLLDQPQQGKNLWQRIGFDAGRSLVVAVSTRAPGDDLYSDERTQAVLSDNPSTETIVLPGDGQPVCAVRIRLPKARRGDGFSLARDVAVNERVPFAVSVPLVVVLTAILLMVGCCLPGSTLAQRTTDRHPRQARLALAVVVGTLCCSVVGVTEAAMPPESHYAYFEYNQGIIDTQQYQHQADAILAGHASLDLPVPDWLRDADNPYDVDLRRAESEATGEPYYFDYAFHDGRYYCYFGPLPAFVLFVPFKAVTGHDLSNGRATEVLAVLAVVSVSALATLLLGRFGRRVTIAGVVLAVVGAVTLSGAAYLAFYPSVYHIAILSSLVCSTGGLSLWLLSDRGERVSRPALLLGSLLVGGCLLSRPVTFLVVLMAFPVFGHRFWRVRREDRAFFGPTAEARANTALVVVPAAGMGAAALLWNLARFGSPLDFGYTYNLTGFDMTARPVDPRRNLFGLAMYLIAPLSVQRRFPFMVSYDVGRGLLSSVFEAIPSLVVEPYYGGILAFCPFTAGVLLAADKGTRMKARRRGMAPLALSAGAIGLAIALFDADVAITQRYQSDFFWLLGVPVLCIALACEASLRRRGATKVARALGAVAVVLVAFSVCACLVNLLALDRYNSLRWRNPQLWWSCYAWFLGPV